MRGSFSPKMRENPCRPQFSDSSAPPVGTLQKHDDLRGFILKNVTKRRQTLHTRSYVKTVADPSELKLTPQNLLGSYQAARQRLSKPIGRDGSPSRPTIATACQAGLAQRISWCRQARRAILPKRGPSGFRDQKFVLSSAGVKNVKN